MDRRVEATRVPGGPDANAPHPTSEQASARLLLASWLRGARAGRGLSLADVTKVTKIQARTLEHLEAGRFDQLPADVFVRGFVRSYARCVGLDPDEAVRRYSECGKLPGPVAATTTAAALLESMAELVPTSVHVIRETPAEPPPVVETDVVAPVVAIAEVIIAAVAPASVEPVATAVEATTPAKKPRKRRAPAASVDGTAKKPRSRKRIAAGTNPPPGEIATDASPSSRVDPSAIETAEANVAADAATELAIGSVRTPGIVEAASEIVTATATATATASGSASETVTGTETETETETGTETETETEIATASSAVPVPVPVPAAAAAAAAAADPVPAPITAADEPPPPAVAPIRIIRVRPPAAPPRLVIDDADPESAALEQDTRSDDEPHKSFLPKALLDNLLDGERPRQGGLTLAVIILLIAATLTLSYLMRRPSSSGEGITSLPPPPASIA